LAHAAVGAHRDVLLTLGAAVAVLSHLGSEFLPELK
jgi:hypothetical protein